MVLCGSEGGVECGRVVRLVMCSDVCGGDLVERREREREREGGRGEERERVGGGGEERSMGSQFHLLFQLLLLLLLLLLPVVAAEQLLV